MENNIHIELGCEIPAKAQIKDEGVTVVNLPTIKFSLKFRWDPMLKTFTGPNGENKASADMIFVDEESYEIKVDSNLVQDIFYNTEKYYDYTNFELLGNYTKNNFGIDLSERVKVEMKHADIEPEITSLHNKPPSTFAHIVNINIEIQDIFIDIPSDKEKIGHGTTLRFQWDSSTGESFGINTDKIIIFRPYSPDVNSKIAEIDSSNIIKIMKLFNIPSITVDFELHSPGRKAAKGVIRFNSTGEESMELM